MTRLVVVVDPEPERWHAAIEELRSTADVALMVGDPHDVSVRAAADELAHELARGRVVELVTMGPKGEISRLD